MVCLVNSEIGPVRFLDGESSYYHINYNEQIQASPKGKKISVFVRRKQIYVPAELTWVQLLLACSRFKTGIAEKSLGILRVALTFLTKWEGGVERERKTGKTDCVSHLKKKHCVDSSGMVRNCCVQVCNNPADSLHFPHGHVCFSEEFWFT